MVTMVLTKSAVYRSVDRLSPLYRPHIGIIDPFIQDTAILTGSIVIVMLYPKTVSEVRHVWDHDEIDAELEYK